MREKIIYSQSTQEYWFEEGCYIQEIGNTEEDPQVSIARARVRPGGHTCWHRLEGVSERYLVTEGRGTVEIGELPPATVSTGDLVVVPPGVRQRIRNDGSGDLVFYAICTPRFVTGCYRSLENRNEC
jgi:mannose-6-phosphate isomerase-like protein (cupin superfamily)